MECLACGYDLRGLGELCPECGREFDTSRPWTVGPRRYSRLDRRLIICMAIAASGPLCSFGLLHLARVAAAIQFGHWPRPMIDDPHRVGGPLQVFLDLVELGCYLMPLSALACLALWVVAISRNRGRAARTMFLVWAGLWVGTVVLAMIDPMNAVEWYLD